VVKVAAEKRRALLGETDEHLVDTGHITDAYPDMSCSRRRRPWDSLLMEATVLEPTDVGQLKGTSRGPGTGTTRILGRGAVNQPTSRISTGIMLNVKSNTVPGTHECLLCSTRSSGVNESCSALLVRVVESAYVNLCERVVPGANLSTVFCFECDGRS
jgi:hypothetical protein